MKDFFSIQYVEALLKKSGSRKVNKIGYNVIHRLGHQCPSCQRVRTSELNRRSHSGFIGVQIALHVETSLSKHSS